MKHISQKIILFSIFLIGLFLIGCSIQPIRNTNQTTLKNSELGVNQNVNASENIVQLKKKPEVFEVEAYVASEKPNFDIWYVNKEQRIKIRNFKNALESKEEFENNPPRVLFNLKDGILREISNRTPISIEIYTIGTFSSIEDWMKDYFSKKRGILETNNLSSKSIDRETYRDTLLIFDHEPTAARMVPLFDPTNGDILLFTVNHENSKELLGLANSMLRDFEMLPDLDFNATTDTSDWQTYRNEEYGFEVKYPRDYRLSQKKEDQALFSLSFVDRRFLGIEYEFPSISLSIFKIGDQEMENWIDTSWPYERSIEFKEINKNNQEVFVVDPNDQNLAWIIIRNGHFLYSIEIIHFSNQEALTVGQSLLKTLKLF